MADGARAPAEIETPLGDPRGPRALPEPTPTPFELLGIPVAYSIDAGDLRRRLVRISRWLHPDFFAGDPGQRALAERNTSELNAAHALLADDRARASFLVLHLRGPDEDEERQMPPAFLLRVLEWNEALDAARQAPPGSPERAALDRLEVELKAERETAFAAIAALLDPLPPAADRRLTEVRKQLNAVRYVDRALASARSLRLDIASREDAAGA